jgi:hypothetical protein
MYAGTIARLEEPIDEPLESRFANDYYPAFDVQRTQTSFDDRPIQEGQAADRVDTFEQRVEIDRAESGKDRSISTERVEERETLLTDWVADVTGTGLIAAESVDGPGPFAFPFDQFYFVGGEDVERLRINLEEAYTAWKGDDDLGNVWMNASDPGDGAQMSYHQQADADQKPTIGLGFERPWDGTVVRGVAYESGYVALYSVESAIKFVRFVGDELLPYAQPYDDEDEQATLGEDDEVCDNCGRDVSVQEYLGGRYCATCIDGHEDGGAALDLSEVRPDA